MPEDRIGVGQGLSNFILCQEKLGKTKIGWEGGKERGKKDRDYGVSCPKMLLAFFFFFFLHLSLSQIFYNFEVVEKLMAM